MDDDFVYCVNVEGLLGAVSCGYDVVEWGLFKVHWQLESQPIIYSIAIALHLCQVVILFTWKKHIQICKLFGEAEIQCAQM